MSTTNPFTTSLSLFHPHLLLLLLLLLFPFTTATTIILHPYPHPHNPLPTNLNLPYNQPISLTFSLFPNHPSESRTSLTHTLSPPSTISFTTTNQTLKASLTLRQIGRTNFSMIAYTTNPFHIYKAYLQITVPGVTIAYPWRTLPAPLPVINLGTFKHWLRISQLAFPLLVQPPLNSRHLHLRVSALAEYVIDSDLCVLRVHNSPHNTRFFRHDNVTTGGVHFPTGCGLALSEDRAWLILRLNPYRVGTYKFGVVFQFIHRNGSYVTGNTTLQFMYEPLVPPVVITDLRVVLDPFGEELLHIPLENVLSPPRKMELTVDQVVLKLFSEGELVSLLKPVDMLRVGDTPRRILRFRTNPLTGKPGHLSIVLEVSGRKAVIDPRHNASIALTSRKTAVLDECASDVSDDHFVKITTGMPYNRTTFTEWKNTLMKRAIRLFFPGEGEYGIRLVDFGDGIVLYAVLVSEESRKLVIDAKIQELDRALRNGSFADAVHAWKDDITRSEVVYMNTSICNAFPHLIASASALEIHGLQVFLLPLFTSFPMAFGFITVVLLTQNSIAKSQETVTSYRSKTSTGEISTNRESSNSRNSKSDSEETSYAPVCSYPSEAREKFARQYHLGDKITSDDLRDSDLESSVDGEREEGLVKLIDVVRKFGQGFGGLGHIWRKLRGFEVQEVEISARTGSTSKSPTIYIERVSHECNFHTTPFR